MRFVFDSGPFAPLYENMTLSTKPEVHKRTEPGPRVTFTHKKLSYRRGTARRTMSVEILSTAPQQYEK